MLAIVYGERPAVGPTAPTWSTAFGVGADNEAEYSFSARTYFAWDPSAGRVCLSCDPDKFAECCCFVADDEVAEVSSLVCVAGADADGQIGRMAPVVLMVEAQIHNVMPAVVYLDSCAGCDVMQFRAYCLLLRKLRDRAETAQQAVRLEQSQRQPTFKAIRGVGRHLVAVMFMVTVQVEIAGVTAQVDFHVSNQIDPQFLLSYSTIARMRLDMLTSRSPAMVQHPDFPNKAVKSLTPDEVAAKRDQWRSARNAGNQQGVQSAEVAVDLGSVLKFEYGSLPAELLEERAENGEPGPKFVLSKGTQRMQPPIDLDSVDDERVISVDDLPKAGWEVDVQHRRWHNGESSEVMSVSSESIDSASEDGELADRYVEETDWTEMSGDDSADDSDMEPDAERTPSCDETVEVEVDVALAELDADRRSGCYDKGGGSTWAVQDCHPGRWAAISPVERGEYPNVEHMTVSSLTVVDLGAGVGSSVKGAIMGGAQVALAVEIDDTYAAIFRASHPNVPLLVADYTSDEVWDRIMEIDPDLVTASTCCEGASRQRFKPAGEIRVDAEANQVTPELVNKAIQRGVKCLMIENVPEISETISGQLAIEHAHQAGYHVLSFELSGADLGFPNLRNRVFFLITRGDQTVVDALRRVAGRIEEAKYGGHKQERVQINPGEMWGVSNPVYVLPPRNATARWTHDAKRSAPTLVSRHFHVFRQPADDQMRRGDIEFSLSQRYVPSQADVMRANGLWWIKVPPGVSQTALAKGCGQIVLAPVMSFIVRILRTEPVLFDAQHRLHPAASRLIEDGIFVQTLGPYALPEEHPQGGTLVGPVLIASSLPSTPFLRKLRHMQGTVKSAGNNNREPGPQPASTSTSTSSTSHGKKRRRGQR